jgi:hypothetical protein
VTGLGEAGTEKGCCGVDFEGMGWVEEYGRWLWEGAKDIGSWVRHPYEDGTAVGNAVGLRNRRQWSLMYVGCKTLGEFIPTIY